MKILKDVLRRNRAAIVAVLAMTAINAAIFLLYDIWAEPMLYAAVLAFLLLASLLAADFLREKKRSAERARTLAAIASEWRSLPEANTLAEADYQAMIAALGAQMERIASEADAERQDMLDYYTAWVHQIKTPIAVMRLKLADDTPEHHALSVELQRIEQYVDMVLQYIRLGSGSTDLVIREFPLDDLIRESVRKLAPQFVEKRLRLVFHPTGATVVTDQKWFVCILDQLLSNAVKYTPSGAVTIVFQDDILTISDTGIGIAPEDLPRIFEKGYTGQVGRQDKTASGLGLYLCRRICTALGHGISAQSEPGKGTVIKLDLAKSAMVYE